MLGHACVPVGACVRGCARDATTYDVTRVRLCVRAPVGVRAPSLHLSGRNF